MKHILIIIGCAFSLTTFAQKEVVSAYNANKDGNYREAAVYIEQAILVEKSMVKDKTWRYRGLIYTNIALDEEVSIVYPNALRIAMESFVHARVLDVKNRYSGENTDGLNLVRQIANDMALGYFNNTEFSLAGNSFDLAYEVGLTTEYLDTMSLANAALSYNKAIELINSNLVDVDSSHQIYNSLTSEKSELIELAIDRYKMCADMNYQIPNVYLSMSYLYRDNNEYDKALQMLQDARVLHPREQALIIEEFNIYLSNNDLDNARKNLALAVEQDPTNDLLWYNLGVIYDGFSNFEEAANAYLKAIEISPEYFDANFNLGAMYYNKAGELMNESSDMWKPRMSSKQSAAVKLKKASALQLFSESLPYLLKAHEINPSNINTINSLKSIYTRNADEVNRLKMEELLKSLK